MLPARYDDDDDDDDIYKAKFHLMVEPPILDVIWNL